MGNLIRRAGGAIRRAADRLFGGRGGGSTGGS